MAFTQFPENLLVKTFDTAEIVSLGKIKLSTAGELKHIRSSLFVNGVKGGTEGIRLRLHTTDDTSIIYGASDWVDLTTLDSELVSTDNLLSLVRFDFSNINLNANFDYLVTAETRNYTRNSDVFYMGMQYDYPFNRYDGVSAINNFTDSSLLMEVFVVK